ncbi:MAG: MFS transporter [Candidatus Bathyarchaeota archaeon]|nr:MAG: MFS transporter [Candidatus Bathyarchaeota archaeon]
MKSGFVQGFTALTVVSFFFVMGNLLIQPILTLYMREVGATLLEVGFMLALSSLISTASRIPFGLASKKYGRKTVILFALITQPLSIISLYLVPSPIWFYPVLIFRAIPFAAYWSSATALASELAYGEKKGEMMGRYFTAFGLAMFFAPLLCSFLTDFITYRSIIMITLVFPVISTLIFLQARILRKKNVSFTFQSTESETRKGSVIGSLRRMFNSTNVKVLVFAGVFMSIPQGIFDALFSIHAKESLLFAPSLIALLFTARGGANALIRTPIGKIMDIIGSRKRPLIIAYIFHTLAFLSISLTSNYLFLVVGMILFGLGWGMRAVSGTTFLIENVQVADKDLALSMYVTTFGIGRFFGSIFVGALAPLLNTYDILKIPAVFIFLVIVAMILFAKEEKQAPR